MPNIPGLFGGPLTMDPQVATESVSGSLAHALTDLPGSPVLSGTPPAPGLAGLSPIHGDAIAGTVTLVGDLTGFTPLPETTSGRAAVVRSLSDAAHALSGLHAQGRLHNALRPACLWLSSSGLTVLATPRTEPDARAVLSATVSMPTVGVSATAYAAPEVVAGHPATQASDVYAVAATAFMALTGSLPVGQFDLSRALGGLPRAHAWVLASALHATPSARPTMDTLATALEGLTRAEAPDAGNAVAGPRGELSAILVLILVVGGFFVLSGAIWLVAVGWDALGIWGRLGLLGMLTAGVWGAGEAALSRRFPRTGLALVTLATQLVWADAAYLITEWHHTGQGGWTAVSATVAVLTLGCTVRLRAPILAVTAAVDVAIFAACLGSWLHTGNPLGPAVFSAAVGVLYIMLTTAMDARGGRAIGMPFGVSAVLALGLSACAGLGLLSEGSHQALGAVWPYGMTVAMGLPWIAGARAPYAALAGAGALVVLAIVPTAEALVLSQNMGFLAAAVAVGVGIAAAGVLGPERLKAQSDETLVCLVGAGQIAAAPGLLALRSLDSTREQQYVAAALGASAVALVTAFALSGRTRRKESYRAMEAAGLVLFFGITTAGSVLHLDTYTYPALVLGGGITALALGATVRRATLVALASVALVVNVWIQYFGKLKDVLPMSLLMVGFGLAILGFGFAFERRVREFLPVLKTWA